MLAWQDETHLFEAFDLDGAGQVTWPNWLQRLEEMRALIPPPLPVGPEPSGPLNAIRCPWMTLATPVQHCAARFAPVPSLRICAADCVALRCVPTGQARADGLHVQRRARRVGRADRLVLSLCASLALLL